MGKHRRSSPEERDRNKRRRKEKRHTSRGRSVSPHKRNESYKHFKQDYSDHGPKSTKSMDSVGKQSLKYHDANNHPSDTEKDISFDWDDHHWELNQIFFNDNCIINRGSEEYHDFWKFAKKFNSLQKGKIIQQMIDKKEHKHDGPNLEYNKKLHINFKLNIPDAESLIKRIPYDLEDKRRRLSVNKIEEFRHILLLYLDFNQKKKFEKLKKLRESQKNLPIAEFKSNIIKTVQDHSVVIIAGDTGCGKSTQVPQYLLSAGYESIACTQPRRIACISLSKRVAFETLNEYGSEIGYQIRFEKKKTEHTKILFLTEGLLLRQVTTDSVLSQYSVIILDEIHERHLHTDFLLGVMKCLIMKRPDIKVILMSATININLFKSYFMDQAPVIQVPGRLFPIKLQYFPIPIIEQCSKSEKINPAPYIRVLQLIDSKYSSDERGDVLIFLSGMSEISTINEAAQAYAEQTHKWIILSLHSTLSVSEQEKVFHFSPPGVRKCILSTNIAETSITIDGVRFVIDSGKVKEMNFDINTKMQKLKEFWVSQASAEQRKGRAGRTGPGVCFRLYSEEEYASFNQYSTPEIQRVSLDSIILQMISMGLPSITLFPFVEPPSSESLNTAISSLKSHNALTCDEHLTTVGQLLAQLPMDVSLGKMLIMGSLFHQVEPVLSLAAVMSVQSPFTNRAYRDPDAVALNKELESDHGDPFTLLNTYKEWLSIKLENKESSRRWCRKRGLEEQRFYEMTKLRSQFSQLLMDSGLCDMAGSNKRTLTGAERAKRHGELKQLLDLKKHLHKKGPKKSQVLKLDYLSHENAGASDEENQDLDVKDVDFKIGYDHKMLQKLCNSSEVHSFKDMILLKIILCCGLYPNVAIADDHNNYKPGSEQVFHTKSKPFVVLHPNSVFASHPEVLELTEADIIDLPDFSRRSPASDRHQILTYVSLLETNKPYLVNSFRVPAAQMLLLYASGIDTNADFSVMVCDEFIQLKFPDAIVAQSLVFKIVQLRKKWSTLLDLRIKAAKPDIENASDVNYLANILEKELTSGLIDLSMNEVIYSLTRLLPADVKLLHSGPGPQDMILSSNPFSDKIDEPCRLNDIKGGVDLTEYLTYNCLLDTTSTVTTITSFDSVCPYCDDEMHCTVVERLFHMSKCINKKTATARNITSDDDITNTTNKKKYFCPDCKEDMFLTIKDIFYHKKYHDANTSEFVGSLILDIETEEGKEMPRVGMRSSIGVGSVL